MVGAIENSTWDLAFGPGDTGLCIACRPGLGDRTSLGERSHGRRPFLELLEAPISSSFRGKSDRPRPGSGVSVPTLGLPECALVDGRGYGRVRWVLFDR